jgi:hypothetical protein
VTNNTQFVKWMLLIALVIVGGGNVAGYSIAAFVPEPMPKLAPATELASLNGWESHGIALEKAWFSEMDYQYFEINASAMAAAGVRYDYCGRWQYDIGINGGPAMN